MSDWIGKGIPKDIGEEISKEIGKGTLKETIAFRSQYKKILLLLLQQLDKVNNYPINYQRTF